MLLGGCGGESDEDQAQARVRDYVKATNARDPALCTEYLSRSFLETSTGQRGRRAVTACRRALKRLGDKDQVSIRLKEIEETKTRAETVRVRVVLDVSGSEQKQTLELRRERGEFRISGTGRE